MNVIGLLTSVIKTNRKEMKSVPDVLFCGERKRKIERCRTTKQTHPGEMRCVSPRKSSACQLHV